MKKFKSILACFLVVMTASLVLVGCGKKDADPDDYLAGVYYEELADNIYVKATGDFSMEGMTQKTTMETKIKRDGDNFKYLQTKTYKVGEETETSTDYREAVNKGLYYEVRSNYTTTEEEIAKFGKVYDASLSTRFELEDEIRCFVISMIPELYDGSINVMAAGDDVEAELTEEKVEGSEKKFTYTAKVVADEIDKGTVTLKVEKKRVVSYAVDVTLKKQAGQEKADYYKINMDFSYKKVDINFDTKGYVERVDVYNFIENNRTIDGNFTITAVETKGTTVTTTTTQVSVANNGTIKALKTVSTKEGEGEAVVTRSYYEYVKQEDGSYKLSTYANGAAADKEDTTVQPYEFETSLIENGLANVLVVEVIEECYTQETFKFVQEGNKITVSYVGLEEEAENVVINVVDGKITTGTVSLNDQGTRVTTVYTYAYGTAEVNYTPTAA